MGQASQQYPATEQGASQQYPASEGATGYVQPQQVVYMPAGSSTQQTTMGMANYCDVQERVPCQSEVFTEVILGLSYVL